MNGPEHYREAERLNRLALEQWENGSCNTASQITLPQAQVHATLALAAATVNTEHYHDSIPLAERPSVWDRNNGDGLTWSEVSR